MNHYLRVVSTHILAMSAIFALFSAAAYGQIVCDQFKIVANLRGASLDLSVRTDLPDNTIVMVSVSRSYLEKGNATTYSYDYFSKESTIGKWKTKQTVSLDDQKWTAALREQQGLLARLGQHGFDVATISDKIDVRMVLSNNQTDTRFGENNSKLSGKCVSEKDEANEGLIWPGEKGRFVKDEIALTYPMQSPPVGKSPIPDFLNLEKGQSYVVSEQTPLMPELDPKDPLTAIQRVKYIPKGGAFKVLEISKSKQGISSWPWYQVVAINPDKEKIGLGWINSGILQGQDLKPYK